MPETVTPTVNSYRMSRGWFCLALLVLTLLPAGVRAAAFDPALRRSEELDIRRLGNVSDDERSVLRIEWRAAVAGQEQTRAVQDMLDSLRRMETTVSEINRLIVSMPARQATVATASSAAEAGLDDKTLALAAGATAGLLGIWWFRRRSPARTVPAVPAGSTDLEPGLPAAEPATGSASFEVPGSSDQAIVIADLQPEQIGTQRAAEPPGEIHESANEAAAAEAKSQALARLAARAASGKLPPERSTAEPAAALPVQTPSTIDFSLEDADPEAVARANARVPKPVVKNPAETPPPRAGNIDATLELAEIMLSMGLEQSAAQALAEYSEANPRQALYHWLKLLDIYRSSGHRKDFKDTAEKLRQYFNIQAEDWTKAGTGEAPTLENFLRVAEQVQQLWLKPDECIAYLRHLLEDNREGARAGFPQPVAEEILLLIEILKMTVADSQAAAP